MIDLDDLLALHSAAVVAPAGHGKTEVIAKLAAIGRRTLVLTHTHAGVHAIRARLKRLHVPTALVVVDTIAGWTTRYARAFPGVAKPPDGEPKGREWDELYRGVTRAIQVKAIREIVAASYGRILIDEYQDCVPAQHELSIALSRIVPTTVFGDPMQGIFEFAGATLNWTRDVHPHFPLAGTLDIPHRWATKNPGLGEWIAETRQRILNGQAIDLADPRINYRVSNGDFDMASMFESIEGKDGSFATIHCRKGICYRLASAANGGYQAIEEAAANRLGEFATAWDASTDAQSRINASIRLREACFNQVDLIDDQESADAIAALDLQIVQLGPHFGVGNGAAAASRFMAISRQSPNLKVYRSELWRDAERAAGELAADRVDSMMAGAAVVRQRTSNIGRNLPRRTVSTPLLLKGLEFDHVVVPHAVHYAREQMAQGKLFYVAISRATHSLTISSPERFLQFPVPAV